jgi:hypothetical protein
VHDFPASRVSGHNGRSKKSSGCVPVRLVLMLENLIGDVPMFFKLTIWTPRNPIGTDPKSMLAGETSRVDAPALFTVWFTLPEVPPLKLASPL